MTNTTKTLEETRIEAREEFRKVLESHFTVKHSGGTNDTLWALDEFAEKVWEAALDACRENIEGLPTTFAVGMDVISREEALSAIDSLRTVEGKERTCDCEFLPHQQEENGHTRYCELIPLTEDSLKDPQG